MQGLARHLLCAVGSVSVASLCARIANREATFSLPTNHLRERSTMNKNLLRRLIGLSLICLAGSASATTVHTGECDHPI
jgi:hypothetical protein